MTYGVISDDGGTQPVLVRMGISVFRKCEPNMQIYTIIIFRATNILRSTPSLEIVVVDLPNSATIWDKALQE